MIEKEISSQPGFKVRKVSKEGKRNLNNDTQDYQEFSCEEKYFEQMEMRRFCFPKTSKLDMIIYQVLTEQNINSLVDDQTQVFSQYEQIKNDFLEIEFNLIHEFQRNFTEEIHRQKDFPLHFFSIQLEQIECFEQHSDLLLVKLFFKKLALEVLSCINSKEEYQINETEVIMNICELIQNGNMIKFNQCTMIRVEEEFIDQVIKQIEQNITQNGLGIGNEATLAEVEEKLKREEELSQPIIAKKMIEYSEKYFKELSDYTISAHKQICVEEIEELQSLLKQCQMNVEHILEEKQAEKFSNISRVISYRNSILILKDCKDRLNNIRNRTTEVFNLYLKESLRLSIQNINSIITSDQLYSCLMQKISQNIYKILINQSIELLNNSPQLQSSYEDTISQLYSEQIPENLSSVTKSSQQIIKQIKDLLKEWKLEGFEGDLHYFFKRFLPKRWGILFIHRMSLLGDSANQEYFPFMMIDLIYFKLKEVDIKVKLAEDNALKLITQFESCQNKYMENIQHLRQENLRVVFKRQDMKIDCDLIIIHSINNKMSNLAFEIKVQKELIKRNITIDSNLRILINEISKASKDSETLRSIATFIFYYLSEDITEESEKQLLQNIPEYIEKEVFNASQYALLAQAAQRFSELEDISNHNSIECIQVGYKVYIQSLPMVIQNVQINQTLFQHFLNSEDQLEGMLVLNENLKLFIQMNSTPNDSVKTAEEFSSLQVIQLQISGFSKFYFERALSQIFSTKRNHEFLTLFCQYIYFLIKPQANQSSQICTLLTKSIIQGFIDSILKPKQIKNEKLQSPLMKIKPEQLNQQEAENIAQLQELELKNTIQNEESVQNIEDNLIEQTILNIQPEKEEEIAQMSSQESHNFVKSIAQSPNSASPHQVSRILQSPKLNCSSQTTLIEGDLIQKSQEGLSPQQNEMNKEYEMIKYSNQNGNHRHEQIYQDLLDSCELVLKIMLSELQQDLSQKELQKIVQIELKQIVHLKLRIKNQMEIIKQNPVVKEGGDLQSNIILQKAENALKDLEDVCEQRLIIFLGVQLKDEDKF